MLKLADPPGHRILDLMDELNELSEQLILIARTLVGTGQESSPLLRP